jgi:hypothetical protein
MSTLTDALRDATEWDAAAWFEAYGKIERKGGEIVSPVANVYQSRISEIIQWAHEHGRPCRIVGLKPRQKGSSTFGVAAAYRRLQAKRGRGVIAGGAHFQGQNLFKILGTYAGNDERDPDSCKVMDMEARFKNGSSLERVTLANANAGRSGTYQVMIITEVAYLAEEGVANATQVLNGFLKCVPMEPDTLIFQESTAKGATGDFYETCQGAITFEEFKAGRNGYVLVFAAWHEFDDSRLDPASEGIESDADLTEEEQRLAAKWQLDLWQVAWMRYAIREECKGDWDRFCQDYPFDIETAFLKSGRCRFEQSGLDYQDHVSSIRPREFGCLDYNAHADRIQWMPTQEHQSRVARWESPRPGCRYLISVDPMTGASQTGGIDPDSHSVLVHRAGYLSHNNEWIEPALVMRNILVPDGVRFGCWWDIDVLEEEVWRMARYWQAIIVPEMNMDRGLVELLKLRLDVDIYQREIFNRRENTRTKALGWMTDTKTRPMVIETLAAKLRESGRGGMEGYEVRCPWAINQLKHFIVKTSGRAEASSGKHDDDVLALAIGVQLLDMATPWREAMRDEWLPRDLMALREARGRVAGGNRTFS